MTPNPLLRPNPYLRADRALQFAVTFATTDLARVTPRKFLTLERLVVAFMNREKPLVMGVDGALGLKQLQTLQAAARHMLENIVQPTTSPTGGNFTIAAEGAVLWLFRDGDRYRIEVLGPPLARLGYHLLDVLKQVGPGKLFGCPALTPAGTLCGQPFFKVTKKEFCSARCQSRTYMRELRAKERREREALTRKDQHGKKTR